MHLFPYVRRYCSSSRNSLFKAGFSTQKLTRFSCHRPNLLNDNGFGVFSHTVPQLGANPDFQTTKSRYLFKFETIGSRYIHSNRPRSRCIRRRESKRRLAANSPVLNEAKYRSTLSQLLPRFTTEELASLMAKQDEPLVSLELFNWATQQPRFYHSACSYHVVIKQLGAARMYEELLSVVNQVLASSRAWDEALFNTIIYFLIEARKLNRAVNVFKRMKKSPNLDCRPSIRTYNILFTTLLRKRDNSYTNHVYMDAARVLFRQMVSDGIEPDIFSLNSMVRGYALALNINEALRVFRQMGVAYKCEPNAITYDHLIHGLCAQSRTVNALKLVTEMKIKGFVPSRKSYNSLVNALALAGEIDEAVKFLWEMVGQRRSADLITYKTVLDEVCRRGRVEDAMKLLKEFRERELVDGRTYKELLYVIEDDYGHSYYTKFDQRSYSSCPKFDQGFH